MYTVYHHAFNPSPWFLLRSLALRCTGIFRYTFFSPVYYLICFWMIYREILGSFKSFAGVGCKRDLLRRQPHHRGAQRPSLVVRSSVCSSRYAWLGRWRNERCANSSTKSDPKSDLAKCWTMTLSRKPMRQAALSEPALTCLIWGCTRGWPLQVSGTKRRRIDMAKDIHDHIEEALPELLFPMFPHFPFI